MNTWKRLLLTAAVLCLPLSGCDYSADVVSSDSEETQELIDVSGYSVHYLIGDTSPDECPPYEVSFMLLTCGREGSNLINATVEICKENGIDYNKLSRSGEVVYSADYAYTVYPMNFSCGKLFVAIGRHVADGVLYSIRYE